MSGKRACEQVRALSGWLRPASPWLNRLAIFQAFRKSVAGVWLFGPYRVSPELIESHRLYGDLVHDPVAITRQGGYFSHLAGLLRFLVLRAPTGLRHLGYLTFPLLDLLAALDRWPRLMHSSFSAFVGGYLVVATRRS